MLGLKLAPVNSLTQRAKIAARYAEVGTFLLPETRLLDLEVDLSDAAMHDCPAITTYRASLWLRAWTIAEGEEAEIGAMLALFAQDGDTPRPEETVRAARAAVTGIVSEPDCWDEAVD